MRVYMRDRWRRRKAKAVAYMGGRCAHCGMGAEGFGEDFHFDHVKPEWKRFTIASRPSRAEHLFWQELMACQLLCGECHRLKTSGEQSVPHGGGITGKKNCLCELCYPLKLEYTRKRRARLQSTAAVLRTLNA